MTARAVHAAQPQQRAALRIAQQLAAFTSKICRKCAVLLCETGPDGWPVLQPAAMRKGQSQRITSFFSQANVILYWFGESIQISF
jgi:hypothetical protein